MNKRFVEEHLPHVAIAGGSLLFFVVCLLAIFGTIFVMSKPLFKPTPTPTAVPAARSYAVPPQYTLLRTVLHDDVDEIYVLVPPTTDVAGDAAAFRSIHLSGTHPLIVHECSRPPVESGLADVVGCTIELWYYAPQSN